MKCQDFVKIHLTKVVQGTLQAWTLMFGYASVLKILSLK